ncbi:universal stress protein [Glycomyces albus]
MSNGAKGKIVVGIDGSPASARALRWAVRQAELTGAEVEAMHAWQVPAMYGTAAMALPGDQLAQTAENTLNEAMADVAGESRSRGIAVSQRLVEAHPAKALIEESKDADLVVVGNRGHGGFVGALIGSVSQQVVHHASCPVVVVRSEN